MLPFWANLCVCLSGFVGPMLYTTAMVQILSYVVHNAFQKMIPSHGIHFFLSHVKITWWAHCQHQVAFLLAMKLGDNAFSSIRLFVRDTLCTTSWGQECAVHQRPALCTTDLRSAPWCTYCKVEVKYQCHGQGQNIIFLLAWSGRWWYLALPSSAESSMQRKSSTLIEKNQSQRGFKMVGRSKGREI